MAFSLVGFTDFQIKGEILREILFRKAMDNKAFKTIIFAA